MALLNQIAPCKRQAQDAKDAFAHERAEYKREARIERATLAREQDAFDKATRKAMKTRIAAAYISKEDLIKNLTEDLEEDILNDSFLIEEVDL
jgi:hypothetical protein